MARFIATKKQIAQAKAKLEKEIKKGATQYSLAAKYETHQPMIFQVLKGLNPSNRLIKEILEA